MLEYLKIFQIVTCLDLFFAVKAKKRKVEQMVDKEEMAAPAEEQGEASQEAAEDSDSDSDSSDDEK